MNPRSLPPAPASPERRTLLAPITALFAVAALTLLPGCDRVTSLFRGTPPATTPAFVHQFRHCPAETHHAIFLSATAFLCNSDDQSFGIPMVRVLPGILQAAGIDPKRITALELLMIGKDTGFLLSTPDASRVIDDLARQRVPSRDFHGDTLYSLTDSPEDPAQHPWGWVLLEPNLLAVGRTAALEEILHTTRGRNETLAQARPELHPLMRTGAGCDNQSYTFFPRKAGEALEAIRDLLTTLGFDPDYLGFFPMPRGFLSGTVVGKSKAFGFIAADLGNTALARVFTRWGRLVGIFVRAGVLEGLPDIDKTDIDQESGMLRIAFHIRRSVWDRQWTKLHEDAARWERLQIDHDKYSRTARQLLAPGTAFELATGTPGRTGDAVRAEVIERTWDGSRIAFRMRLGTPGSQEAITNFGIIPGLQGTNSPQFHLIVNAGATNEHRLRIEGNRLVGQLTHLKASIEWRPVTR